MQRFYGWRPSKPDQRNFKFVPTVEEAALPPMVDLRTHHAMPEVWDQGNLGSCTAHGSGAIHMFMHCKSKSKICFTPSRLAIYRKARSLEGTVDQDAGATVADVMKALNQEGAGHETLWPYDVSKFKLKPSKSYLVDAARHKITKYESVDNSRASVMKAALAAGKPIVFGFTVYESFESEQVSKTGMVPMPRLSESALGGHCVALVGYDDSKQLWIVRNSWGDRWGDEGYCYFPYQYLTNHQLACDFWVCDVVA